MDISKKYLYIYIFIYIKIVSNSDGKYQVIDRREFFCN